MKQQRVPCPSCGHHQARFERRVAGFALERCAACALVYVNPQPLPDDLAAHYRAKAAATEAEFYQYTVSPAQIAEYDRIVQDLVRLQPARGRLLDLGCAAGYFMQRAGGAGFETHGIDIATWVEEVAARRGVANVRACRLLDAAFPDGWFDVIHSSQVFEHLTQPLVELAEIRRILKPGGLLYVNVPNYRCLSIVLGRDDFELNTPPEHVVYYTPHTLAALLARAGLTVLGTASYGGLKWENLLGRPISSEIAEFARTQQSGGDPSLLPVRTPPTPGVLGRLARRVFYRRLQVGMTLEAFASKPAR